MQTYEEFQPTGFDVVGAFLPERQDWLVLPTSRTRDSGVLDESNFTAALELLGGEGEDVEVHRFGHWACGWFEVILVCPDTDAAIKAEEVEACLENYPVLDEDDYSEREWTLACETWEAYNLRDKIQLCVDAGLSMFAARRESIPDDGNGYIFERLVAA